MLKAIRSVNCSRGLAACQRMMICFSAWLCEDAVHGADVSLTSLRTHMPSRIEADWLWNFLSREVDKKTLLLRAKTIAGLSGPHKHALRDWINAVADVAAHFGPAPPAALPTTRPIPAAEWKAYKTLMQAFYDRGLHDVGLPYLATGTPTSDRTLWLTYNQFVDAFRETHRLDPHPDAREVCVLCGGELGQTAVDHWIRKAAFPLLAVCANNLLPICAKCNESPNKGQKDVHTDGVFENWFHPFLRHTNGALHLKYSPPTFKVTATSASPAEALKVQKLDELLNLTVRWTCEFRAEHRKKQKELHDRRRRGRGPNDLAEGHQWLIDYRDSLITSEPNYEVHRVLAESLLDPSRMKSFLSST